MVVSKGWRRLQTADAGRPQPISRPLAVAAPAGSTQKLSSRTAMGHPYWMWTLMTAVLCLATSPCESSATRRSDSILQPQGVPGQIHITHPLKPSTEQPKNRLAYVLLIKGMNDMLSNILTDISTNLQPWTPGDLIIFHTGLSAHHQEAIQTVAPQAQLHQIPEQEWKLPAVLNAGDLPKWHGFLPWRGVGYRHMCRWYSIGLFKYLNQLGYKWVFRLDHDSRVHQPVSYDMVHMMEEKKMQYGFRTVAVDVQHVIYGLPELTAWHIQARKLTPTWLYESCAMKNISGLTSEGWNKRIIYNNMFMTNITWWLSQPVQLYLSTLDGSMGFYEYRWGDAPVHTMVVRTFLSRDKVHCFDWDYSHKKKRYREGVGVYNTDGSW